MEVCKSTSGWIREQKCFDSVSDKMSFSALIDLFFFEASGRALGLSSECLWNVADICLQLYSFTNAESCLLVSRCTFMIVYTR